MAAAVTETFVFFTFGRRKSPAKRRGSRDYVFPSMEENAPKDRALSPNEQAEKKRLDVDVFENRLVFDMSM